MSPIGRPLDGASLLKGGGGSTTPAVGGPTASVGGVDRPGLVVSRRIGTASAGSLLGRSADGVDKRRYGGERAGHAGHTDLAAPDGERPSVCPAFTGRSAP